MMGHGVAWLRVLPGAAASLSLATLVLPCIAADTDVESDGVYGRLDGDVSLSPHLGVQLYRGQAEPTLGFQAMYVSTLGLSISHADTRLLFGAQSADRSLTSVEFKLCPLFLGRWSQALEAGPPLLDLTLDSLTLGLGAFWDYDLALGVLRRGTSLTASLSFPLLSQMSGPWLGAMLGLRMAEGSAYPAQTYLVSGVSVSYTWLIDSTMHEDR
jgi:hypothetical protein